MAHKLKLKCNMVLNGELLERGLLVDCWRVPAFMQGSEYVEVVDPAAITPSHVQRLSPAFTPSTQDNN
jgi:hypothetical protein